MLNTVFVHAYQYRVFQQVIKQAKKFCFKFDRLSSHSVLVESSSKIKSISKLNIKDKHSIRTGISKILLKKKNSNPPVLKLGLIMIKNLAKGPSIVVIHADKGHVTVILDKSMHNDKAYELLNDNSTYEILKKDLMPSIQKKLNFLISELEKNKLMDPSLARNLKCYTGSAPVFYGVPKIHKPCLPLWPIIDYTSSPLYNLSCFLSNLLKLFTVDSVFSLNSTFPFLDELKQIKVPTDSIMISLDVVSLFTSIPIQFACNVIKEIYPNYTINSSLNIDNIIELTSGN